MRQRIKNGLGIIFKKIEMRKKIISMTALAVVFFAISNPSWAANPTFENPIGTNSLTVFIDRVLSNLSIYIASIAVVFVLIGGIMYMASAGDEKRIEKAKAIFTSALIGLFIALAAPTFIHTIVYDIFQGNFNPIGAAPSFKVILTKVLNFLLSIVGTIGIIGLVSGGIMYLTSYGNEERIEKGKKILVASIIGIVICLGALLIVRQIGSFFGLS